MHDGRMTLFRLHCPDKNAMQSGTAKTGQWLLEAIDEKPQPVDPLMGWTGLPSTLREIRLRFATKEAAIAYAKQHQLEFEVVEPHARKTIMKSYADNFAYKAE